LALADSQGRLAIAALLGLAKYLDGQTADNLSSKVSQIKWISDIKSVYLSGLPLTIISRLESTAQELKNESLIEGSLISQEWYIETLFFQKYLFSLNDYFSCIKSFHDDYFKGKFEKMVSTNQLLFAAQFILRWVEFTNKYQRLVYVLTSHIEDCSRFRKLKDLSWISFDAEQEKKDAQNRATEVIDRLIALLPMFKDFRKADDLPDYFGQALTMGVEACFEACASNNSERLSNIFTHVFQASIVAHDITRQRVQEWSREDSKIIYSTEPLINLFEITGYAKLYSELYQNQKLWNVLQNVWDAYLAALPDARQTIEFMIAVRSYRDSLFTQNRHPNGKKRVKSNPKEANVT
jgi:hypothetical protein